MSATVYKERQNQFEQKTKQLSRQLACTGISRFISFAAALAFGYFAWMEKGIVWPGLSGLLLILFILLVAYYRRISNQLEFTKTMAVINLEEAAFLAQDYFPGNNGSDFIDTHHPYSYDIDLFGNHSLYQYLNRTTSMPGAKALAKALTDPDTATIAARQEAIATLKTALDFRQRLMAYGKQNSISAQALTQLYEWTDTPCTLYGKKLWYILLLVLPAAFLICLLFSSFDIAPVGSLATGLFCLNMVCTGFLFVRFRTQTNASSGISKSLQQLAAQLSVIEKEKFSSVLLRTQQQKLLNQPVSASTSIARLARLFNNLDSIYNLPVSILLNGSILFHPHTFYAIEKWKTAFRSQLPAWLDALGEMEALGSFGNFACNNPGYTTPITSSTENLSTTGMGHPLIPAAKRVTNSISLSKEKFVVLTGSNMSGKSTFLRTLAINLVLAKTGSVVCAESFCCYPYDLFLSMRINDSLADNESFFYAELKRLQQLIGRAQQGQPVLVLLDEILRGTNSNDKHNGTVGLIRKLAAMRVCGIIATHDVTIGTLRTAYEGYMTNKCFEAQISSDTIQFDYLLKDGVCSQLSASFLMKQLGIID